MQRLIETSKDSEMSDNEGEQAGHPPGVNARAAEQPLIGQPQIVQPSIRPVANFQVTPPEKFSFKPEEWPKWIQRFERFRKATGLDKQSGENQVNTLIYTMGEQADDIFISFEFTAEQEKSYEEVKERFENHFIVKRNVIFERAKFNSRNQRAGESVDSFITDLYGLARHCNFGTLKEELIRDRIVVGLQNRELSEKLQLDPNLTLEKATNLARQRETVKQQQNILDGGFKSTPAQVDGIAKGKSRRKKGNSKDNSQDKSKEKPSENSKEKILPIKSVKGVLEIFTRRKHAQHASPSVRNAPKLVIGRRLVKVRNQEIFEVAEEEESFFLGEIVNLSEVQSNAAKSPWMATVLVDKNPVDFKLDSGADVTVVPYNTFLNLDLQTQLQPTDKVLLGPCNYKLNCKGKFTVTLTYNLNSVKETVYAVESLARPLLGRSAAVKLNLISRLCELTSDDYKAKVMHDYPKLFTGLGMMKEEYTIKLKDETKPFALTVPRKVPMPLYEETKNEITRMIQSGVISPVDHPTDWCAPMVVTPKPNGKVRVCVD